MTSVAIRIVNIALMNANPIVESRGKSLSPILGYPKRYSITVSIDAMIILPRNLRLKNPVSSRNKPDRSRNAKEIIIS